ncbi:MAG: PAS domain S-box protein [Nitrospirota bacterium]
MKDSAVNRNRRIKQLEQSAVHDHLCLSCETREGKYRSLMENIPDIVWTADEQFTITFVSRNVERIAGYTPDEVCSGGRDFFLGRIHPEDRETVVRSWKALFEKGERFDIEFRGRRKDGAWIWLRDRAITTYEREGVRYADGLMSDISEWKRTSERLQEQENLMQIMLSVIPDIVFLKDRESIYRMVNPAFCRLLNIPEDGIVGKSDYDLFSVEEAERFRSGDLEVMRSGGPLVQDEVVSGIEGKRWVQAIKVPVIDASGAILGVLGSVRDITRRKKLEEEREKLIADLREALGRIRTLRGLLPICSSCKKIRDDRGYWNQIEAYVHEHSEAEFSHGICPECSKRLYPDYFRE